MTRIKSLILIIEKSKIIYYHLLRTLVMQTMYLQSSKDIYQYWSQRPSPLTLQVYREKLDKNP